MNGLDKIFIFLILARVQNFAHSQSLIANLTAVFNFSLPGSGDEYSEASGESNGLFAFYYLLLQRNSAE